MNPGNSFTDSDNYSINIPNIRPEYIPGINQISIEGNKMIYDKKQANYKSPDLTKMQEVIIDLRTKIYIAIGADPEEARSRYFNRIGNKKL